MMAWVFPFVGLAAFDIKPRFPVNITDHEFWIQVRICHPPFDWKFPHGIDDHMSLFWAQPENKRHFEDTSASEHCAVVRIVKDGSVVLPFPSISNVTHFINIEADKPAKQTYFPQYDKLLVLTGHWGFYFQHFFDNIGPQLSVALDVIGMKLSDLSVLVETSKAFPNVPRLWRRMGFKRVLEMKENGGVYSAKMLTFVESCPMIHPHYFEHLRRILKTKQKRRTLIIWISRKQSNSYYDQRFILNEDEVIEMLDDAFGAENVVAFDHNDFTLSETTTLFASASVIIGAHGGGFYNQFFAPNTTTIVEILPIARNGLYHGQSSSTEIPSFAHMAVWSNSQLIGQDFWRYYAVSSYANFEVDIRRFQKFLFSIPALAVIRERTSDL